jgi:hypothetical protein
MKRSGRVAFVYYPFLPITGRLETMPFALEAVRSLAQAGWKVDLFLWEAEAAVYQTLLPQNVVIRWQKRQRSLLGPQPRAWLEALRYGSYDCIFAVSQKGLGSAASLQRSNGGCPLVYLSEEFPSAWPPSAWGKRERRAAQKATAIITPDAQRIELTRKELGLGDDALFAALPNIPAIDETPEIDWYQRLGLPPGCVPFLHAGSISDWAQAPELLTTVPFWPENTALILQCRAKRTDFQQYEHLQLPGRVFWQLDPLPPDELHSLIKFCAASFALYRNTGPNLALVGMSSGKLMRSLACGVPVIASDLASLAFVREQKVGLVVRHPAEIPAAVTHMIERRADYRDRCLEFSRTTGSYARHWNEFAALLESRMGFNLARGPGQAES